MTNFIEGRSIYINKPLYWSSFRVIRVVRAKICQKLGIKKLKVGHAGTLDPLATGVMVLCTGKMTKQIEHIQAEEKEYVAEIRLGATTPSFDLETDIDATYLTSHITPKLVEEVLSRFIGEKLQIPPRFSAVKVKGKRAYELARKNQDIELKPKLLVISCIELLNCNLPDIKIRVICSKGTYIRALARDIGEALQSCAHLTGLVLTSVGDITLAECLNMEDIDSYIDQQISRV